MIYLLLQGTEPGLPWSVGCYGGREERARAIGIWAGIAAISVPLGLIIGGALLENFWWGSIFLFNVPIIAGAIVAGAFLIPESRLNVPPKVDLIGVALSISSLSILIYAVIDAPSRGWLDPLTIGAFVAAFRPLLQWRRNALTQRLR